MGHGWKNRCEVAHTNLVQKYEKVKLREFLWPIPHVTMEEAGELHGFLGLVSGAYMGANGYPNHDFVAQM